jgi:RNA polymerase sigma factor (sigma-70 family)
VFEAAKSVFNYALTLDPGRADDIVAEAVRRVMFRDTDKPPIRYMKSYLRTTVHNLFCDGWRENINNPVKAYLYYDTVNEAESGAALEVNEIDPWSYVVQIEQPEEEPDPEKRTFAELDLSCLTKKEHRVLLMKSWGYTNAKIAHELDCEETTVRTHLANGKKKLAKTNQPKGDINAD